jgi:hypothetical protein
MVLLLRAFQEITSKQISVIDLKNASLSSSDNSPPAKMVDVLSTITLASLYPI